MKILIAHSSNYDYEKELYEPLKHSSLSATHHFVFPHDPENKDTATKEQLKDAQLLIAEVSYPSTGEGIEIGWADAANAPMLFLYKSGTKPSSSLRFLDAKLVAYKDTSELVAKVAEHLETMQGSEALRRS